MLGLFACPECGTEVEPAGLAPGRYVRCPGCSTLVEVPFIPRLPQARTRSQAPRLRVWTAIVTALVVVFVIVGAARWAVSRHREAAENQVVGLIASSEAAEAAGQIGRALAQAEAALTLAQDRPMDDLCMFQDLRRRRDLLSRRDIENRLDAIVGLDRPRAIGECLTLQSRAQTDPALAALQGRIGATLAGLAGADLADARLDLEAGRSELALTRCERILTTTAEGSPGSGGLTRDEARALALTVVERFGVLIEPVRGKFTLGSSQTYDKALHPLLVEALRARYYLPRPTRSPFQSLWDRSAGYQLVVEVVEHQDREYLGTVQRATGIEGRLNLSKSGWPAWDTQITARTRSSVPGLSTYGASRIVLGSNRSESIERRLYDDAWNHLLDQVAHRLDTLPEPLPGLAAVKNDAGLSLRRD
ncbi:MAG: hypothetical protein ABI353_01580 [Isosphaeraceae bacterium]